MCFPQVTPPLRFYKKPMISGGRIFWAVRSNLIQEPLINIFADEQDAEKEIERLYNEERR